MLEKLKAVLKAINGGYEWDETQKSLLVWWEGTMGEGEQEFTGEDLDDCITQAINLFTKVEE